MKLSILVPTTPRRLDNFFPRLLKDLQRQSEPFGKEVEIIGLYDNKVRTVGEKRNALLSLAQGEFLTFIDDDDRVAETYIKDIMDCISKNPGADVIVFDCITTINGDTANQTYSRYSVKYQYTETPNKIEGYRQWTGLPAHTMVWRSSIAVKHGYIHQNYAEDVDWVKRAVKDVKTEIRIDKVLYFYDFNSSTSETRG